MLRSKFCLALYLKIRNYDRSITPPLPLHIFNHCAQGAYNAGKIGDNKEKEIGQLIALTGLTLPFKTKYILHMIDVVKCNVLHLFQAVIVCLQYIKSEEREETSIEIGKLRKNIATSKIIL